MYLNLIVPVLFLVSSTLATGIAPPKCGPGEVYKKCGTCDPGCKEPKPICPKKCRAGCFCEEGLVRDNDSNCIPRLKCPGGCEEGEIYKDCGGCDKSCDNLDPVCAAVCQQGCFCIDDYVRNATGQCIPADDCPKCKDNEVYSDCGGCDKSCGNRNPVCDKSCHVGCFCASGYVRDIKGNCISVKDCPKCGANEVYSECGRCDKTCDNLDPVCTLECRIGCFCKDGYARDCTGKCILIKNCPPPKCKPGEVYTDCGTCDGTCDNPNVICTQQCRIGCFCEKNYLRNKDGNCIPEDDCPVPQCNRNEIYKKCGTCDGTCKNPNPICSQVCTKGCFCKDKYVRNEAGDCVPVNSCCE